MLNKLLKVIMINTERYATLKQFHETRGSLNYYLEVFGDHIAISEGYKSLNGIKALRYYLMQKHNWLPSTVQSLSYEDLSFALSQEQEGWTLPKEAL